MRDISGAAVPTHSWTAWPHDPEEWFATHQRSTLWKGETCSYYHGQRSEYAPPAVAVIIWDLLLPEYAACFALSIPIWSYWRSYFLSRSPDPPSWQLNNSKSSLKGVTASKMACAASSKYLDLAGDRFAAGHLPRCSLVIIGSHAETHPTPVTSSLVARTCCLHRSWPWTLPFSWDKTLALDLLHWKLAPLYTGNID
jgi:hypothetical protein